jgi:hypothetical protein
VRRVPKVPGEVEDRAIKALSDGLDGIIRNPIANGVLVEGIRGGAQSVLEVPHGLGRKAVGCLVLGAEKGMYLASVRSSDARVAKVAMSPQWEWMERYSVDTDLSADFNFESLVDGETDGEYMVEGYWLAASGASNILRWRINDKGSSLDSEGSTYRHTGVTTSTDTTGLVIDYKVNTGSASEHFIRSVLAPTATGSQRFSRSSCSQTWGATSSSQEGVEAYGKWEDSVERIGKLGLSFTGNNCLAGSYFDLYRRPRLEGRTLNLWIF